jgi:hypothetical protein
VDLAELRQALKVGSGRYDLDNAGLDRFLNAGQRYLDNRVQAPNSMARAFKTIQAGGAGVTFSASCRVITEVWAADSESRTRLTKVDATELRLAYPGLVSRNDGGRPLYYMPAVLRTAPDVFTMADLHAFMGHLDVLAGTSYGFNGVIFYPPADRPYNIEIWGRFYTADLSDANPASYWAVNHPHLLLMAARREMEADLRNTAGVNDFDNSMARDLRAIELDVIEQESVDIERMLG